jgi:hypothetical protein
MTRPSSRMPPTAPPAIAAAGVLWERVLGAGVLELLLLLLTPLMHTPQRAGGEMREHTRT